MRARGTLALVGLAVTVSLTGWLYQQAVQERDPGDGRYRHDPDSFIDGVDLSSLDANGQLKHRLRATRMLHYPDDDSATLSQPYLEIYRPVGPPWQVNAEHGWISRGGAEVLLEDQVKIERHAAQGIHATRFDTSKLRAFPDRDYAETDAPIRYRSAGLEVKSVGMRAYLEQGRIELLSQVRAVHQPQ